jgi:hypothetical protein
MCSQNVEPGFAHGGVDPGLDGKYKHGCCPYPLPQGGDVIHELMQMN